MAGGGKFSRRPPGAKRPPLTHFLCVPLVKPSSKRQLEESLARFRQDVCSPGAKFQNNTEITSKTSDAELGSAVPAVYPKAIRPVGSLHLTLGVMSLDTDGLTQAVEALHKIDLPALLDELSPKISSGSRPKPQPIKVNLTGLESMHDPHKTSILYISPHDPSGRLYPLCSSLQAGLKSSNLLIEDNRELKLHATVVNTIYTKGRKPAPGRGDSRQNATNSTDRSQGHGQNANAPLKIDSTAILEKYKRFQWAADVVLDRLAICEMGAKKVLDASGNVVDEVYTEVASISLLP